ncbi:hypothetical protein BU26DRAFT_6047 [Trematosphaeria pertusa]|uniref:Arrestin-like N-terminal domain-containing protein n=1 Tax=Trematosphaeria pertusa TaxID=390896 RepID=A0A6A6J2L2_9PLEO|nr:uncharacterized protein BU26DRAFT_6047 [Trematosphaeria pertusa]KAF2255693.1 hypothetical protein BU26DRAFT_6047 [Trematosphaeria pertusa]
MAAGPSLRIVVDGDSSRVYRRGERVTGRVILGIEEQDEIRSLRVCFAGTCTTKTTRPFYVTGNDADATQSRRAFEERICLFNFRRDLLPRCTLAPKKYTWTFAFRFPELTEPKYSRWTHGSKYSRGPHPLPPSFHQRTNSPDGQAKVSYHLQAKLVRGGPKATAKTYHPLVYQPAPRDIPQEPRITSSVLYAQTWKPLSENRTAVDKALVKISRRTSAGDRNPRIIPTIHYPQKIAPGQHIPLLLSLTNVHRAVNHGEACEPECILDSLTVSISTCTTSMCGQPMSQPEDVVLKHVTCLSKTDLNETLPFGTATKLTNNFRLVDNAECVPSFRTYTIIRRYDLTVTVGIKYGDRSFTIRSTMPLEILPRTLGETSPALHNDAEADIEPLPLYAPREPSKEFAPSYEALYSLSRTHSSSGSLAYTESRSLSVASGISTPALGACAPAPDLEQADFGELPMRSRC